MTRAAPELISPKDGLQYVEGDQMHDDRMVNWDELGVGGARIWNLDRTLKHHGKLCLTPS